MLGPLLMPVMAGLSSAIASAALQSAPPSEPPAALPGIGSVVTQDGQLFMSTLSDNSFSPTSYGWELYGEEL
jgi:hypothetical protein